MARGKDFCGARWTLEVSICLSWESYEEVKRQFCELKIMRLLFDSPMFILTVLT